MTCTPATYDDGSAAASGRTRPAGGRTPRRWRARRGAGARRPSACRSTRRSRSAAVAGSSASSHRDSCRIATEGSSEGRRKVTRRTLAPLTRMDVDGSRRGASQGRSRGGSASCHRARSPGRCRSSRSSSPSARARSSPVPRSSSRRSSGLTRGPGRHRPHRRGHRVLLLRRPGRQARRPRRHQADLGDERRGHGRALPGLAVHPRLRRLPRDDGRPRGRVGQAGWSGRGAYTIDIFTREERVQSQAFMRAALNIGFTVGALIGGLALATNSDAVVRAVPVLTGADPARQRLLDHPAARPPAKAPEPRRRRA